jgi:hypothetical protein
MALIYATRVPIWHRPRSPLFTSQQREEFAQATPSKSPLASIAVYPATRPNLARARISANSIAATRSDHDDRRNGHEKRMMSPKMRVTARQDSHDKDLATILQPGAALAAELARKDSNLK